MSNTVRTTKAFKAVPKDMDWRRHSKKCSFVLLLEDAALDPDWVGGCSA